ncbi:cytochrome P450 2J6-like isoform X2 [Eublepharis macularius]|uniref:Cytochrome P450 2J6-like isoform X2 n=1 Tax=Eublepharis macularius TaxID=481883 RepID=A0AA97KHZ2_EUBMA|nr:cytochrome P450 2J6-like isoform X2 [Eublepharis macularius]
MEIFSWLLLILFILYLFWKTVRPKQFPPGPMPLPFIGNLLQFNASSPLKDLDKYAQKYGPIFTLYLGGEPFVFVQGFSLVKEVLLTRGAEFAGRPENAIVEAINNKKGLITAPYGQVWKEQRRFLLMSLRNFGLGKKSMEEKILDEATYLIQIFEENMNVPFDACGFIVSAVANIISTIVFGKRFNYDDKLLRNVLGLIHESSTVLIGPWAQLYNAVPLVRRLPLPHRNIINIAKKFAAFISKEVEEHRTTLVPGDHRDITDAYLEELQKPENKGSSFEEENMLITLGELFLAGVETTATTLEWALLYMMAFPEVQEKCHVELNNVLGNNPCIKYEDRDKLPYTNAVIHEIQRFANVVPVGIPHAPVKDMQLFGYTIPKDTTIITSLISVHYDESQWKYPREFNPSNFLNEKGEFVKPEAFLAFSAGPRVCLGENLARMELFLFFTHIMRRFQVVWPDETKAPDLTPNFGVTMSPSRFKVTLKCHPQV